MLQGASLDKLGEQILSHILGDEVNSIFPAHLTLDALGAALGSHIGQRRKRNEDRCAIARIQISNTCCYTLAVICDGVGGSEIGHEAAATACAAAISFVGRQTACQHPKYLLPHLTRETDDIVRLRLKGRGLTTFTILLANNKGDLAIASIGDSRAYSWEPSSDLIQLIEDDTFENELKHLNIKDPAFLKERGLKGSLSQALGETERSSSELNIDIIDGKKTPPGGFLLATDGVWKLSEDAFLKIAKNSSTVSDLVRRCITAASWLGGLDNSSAIALKDPLQFCTTINFFTAPYIIVWTPSHKAIFYIPEEEKSPLRETPAETKTKPAKRARQSKKQATPQLQLVDPEKQDEKNNKNIQVGPDDQ
ncbi:PP2C family serine/threonine-protein phosphatase [Xanthomonas campestris pv. campestris]|uniref:PP2C family protein-serine/threonine phosphatase n=1 Tax=Xanthomonas campestris TaxID=339 RepID=UPI002B3A514A|nr:PP2C family serine/threonine-protein phosphatase [Xanthomonas campestris pv. campestris]WVL67934.1 PP2C family serine/threonine-protein phosphatase [Xanthomonas campestris pv. campestris]